MDSESGVQQLVPVCDGQGAWSQTRPDSDSSQETQAQKEKDRWRRSCFFYLISSEYQIERISLPTIFVGFGLEVASNQGRLLWWRAVSLTVFGREAACVARALPPSATGAQMGGTRESCADTKQQGLKPDVFWALYGTTEVVP